MCGICGIIDYKGNREDNYALVKSMISSLRHRGPDSQGVKVKGAAVLGHARLAVIDLSLAANQPMHSADGRFTLVYNGEIYNFKELRRALEKDGCSFKSASDTEVLLKMYEKYGQSCVSMLSGMFAFAVWDAQDCSLFLARDRFGQKPVFYSSRGDRFSFASTLEALFCDLTLDRSPDLNAVFHYLTVQSVPAPLCAFEGVKKLGPGECLLFREGCPVKIWKYWKPAFTHSFIGSEDEAVEELDVLLQRAVDTHLESDVPLGLFLSGGVDSSLITAIACRKHNDIRSFSMGFAEKAFDERPFAREVAQICGSNHTDETASTDILDLIPQIVRHYGEPYADSSAVPTWLLSQMTSQNVTVALSGDGGDDLFGGYERYLNPFLYAPGDIDNPDVADIKRQLDESLRSRYKGSDHYRHCLDARTVKYHFHWARFCGNRKLALCSDALLAEASPPLSLALMLDHFKGNESMHLLDKIQLFEMEYYLASTLMTKVDVASMWSSLEVRSPFLDNDVSDFALSLPVSMRVRKTAEASGGSFGMGYEPKWLLKRVAEKYLPNDIIYRRKMGFGVPLGGWLRGGLRELMQDTLLSHTYRSRGWLNPVVVERLVNEHLEGTADHHYGLWALLMLELWAQEYFGQS